MRVQKPNNSEGTNINTDINLDFEEDSPFQKGVILEAYQRPGKLFFKNHEN